MKDATKAAMAKTAKAWMLADSIVTAAIILGTIVGLLAFAIYLAWK